MVIVELEQGTKAWHDWRMMGLGGSDISSLLGNAPFDDCTPDALWKQKTGRIEKSDNFQMRMGRAWEPLVRQWFTEHSGIDCKPMCVQHDVHDWVHASLDGINKTGDIIAEIKCPSAETHNRALMGQVPEYYLAQVQWQLLATGAKECRYVSYYGYDKPGAQPKFHESLKFVEIVVKPDHEVQNRIYRIARAFWIRVESYWAKQSIPKRIE